MATHLSRLASANALDFVVPLLKSISGTTFGYFFDPPDTDRGDVEINTCFDPPDRGDVGDVDTNIS